MQYGDGPSAHGTIAYDVITVGGFTLPKQYFGEPLSASMFSTERANSPSYKGAVTKEGGMAGDPAAGVLGESIPHQDDTSTLTLSFSTRQVSHSNPSRQPASQVSSNPSSLRIVSLQTSSPCISQETVSLDQS